MIEIAPKVGLSHFGNRPTNVEEKETLRIANTDSKGRLVLGASQANKMFRVSLMANGNLLLEPVVVVHEQEAQRIQTNETPEGSHALVEGTGYLSSFFEDSEATS